MDSNTTPNQGNRLFITRVNVIYHIEDRYFPSVKLISCVFLQRP